jgi:hypothetical protein
VDGVVLAQTLGHKLQEFAVFGGVLLDLEGQGVAAGQQGEQFAAGGLRELLVPAQSNR